MPKNAINSQVDEHNAARWFSAGEAGIHGGSGKPGPACDLRTVCLSTSPPKTL